MKRFILTAIIFAMVLSGLFSCKISTEALTSENKLPTAYHAGRIDTLNLAATPWHLFYQDSCLRELVEQSLMKNQDLNVALQRINVTRSDYGITNSNLLPAIHAGLNSSVRKFGAYTMDGVGNDDTNNSETLPEDKHLPNPYTEMFAGLTFSWEADLWGKLSNQRKAALSRLLATQEAYHVVTASLVGNVARNYYELLGLDQEQNVLQENLELQQLGLELIKIQKAGGKVNQLAVDQFEAQLLNTQNRLVGVRQRILVTESKINLLLGRYPQRIDRYSIFQYDTLSDAFAGTPEQLLRNRPDIRKAEYELAASHADVDVARASFYPALKLNAGAGLAAFDISKWFLMPGSAVYNLGAGLSAPVFQRKQIKFLYEAANARQRMALLQYEKAIMNGYHEVFTVLHNLNTLGEQVRLKQEEVRVLNRAFDNSNDLFSVGYASYLEVITAQRRLLEVELELTHLRKEQLKNRAVLYRSLGGGWIPADK